MPHNGLLIVVSAPSGTGKGTLLGLLKGMSSNIKYSVSATTRAPREGEVDGRDYLFKTRQEFEEMVEKGEFVEWVQYCGNYYGTPKKFVDEAVEQGFDVILEVEVEGAMNIKKLYPDCILIFVLPPSMEELKNRIRKRGTEEGEVIEKRISVAKKELEFVDKYDYVIINNDPLDAARDIDNIIKAEKLRFIRNKDILKRIGL